MLTYSAGPDASAVNWIPRESDRPSPRRKSVSHGSIFAMALPGEIAAGELATKEIIIYKNATRNAELLAVTRPLP